MTELPAATGNFVQIHGPAARAFLQGTITCRRGPDKGDSFWVSYSDAASSWTAPFVMGPFNTRIVRRSNALLGHFYGESPHDSSHDLSI